ncbi:hypothetical protein [Mucilaginibacter terrae]|uniref:DUF1129 domain-containing protein n=1 Tax=Mucilaginibacter terrae TaxID=1955052 RepID=A0ABU3GRQ5_9SPHI|nr:hypothetical protein [Mucilaginibacter terrae]MDT3402465.1 hypothetical protein [Mucilaginibacter terrae]
MKLSSADINEIKAFISKRGFTEPDLQMEITDHVACRVKEIISTEPQTSLTQAINITHSEFGVMGFSVFEDAMRSNLQKRYFKLFINFWLGNFNFKTLPLMVSVVYLCSIVFRVIHKPEMIFNVTGLLLIGGLVVHGQFNSVRFKRYNKMLTFKMGSSFLIISVALFQLYNLLIIQLEVYKQLNTIMLGVFYGFVMVLLLATIYTVNKAQQHAVDSCIELEEKYKLIKSSTI